jgi:hypothetical protein
LQNYSKGANEDLKGQQSKRAQPRSKSKNYLAQCSNKEAPSHGSAQVNMPHLAICSLSQQLQALYGARFAAVDVEARKLTPHSLDAVCRRYKRQQQQAVRINTAAGGTYARSSRRYT